MGKPPIAAGIDRPALEAFLHENFGPGDLHLTKIAGGQSNPTFFVDHGDRRMVLRKQPPVVLARGAHAIDREFRILKALRHTPVPVPDPILFHAEPDILDTPFYLMERIDGRVFQDCTLPGVPTSERTEMYMSVARTLASLHALRPEAVGLADYGPRGNYFERQLTRWTEAYRRSSGPPIPALDTLTVWLRDNLPRDDGQVTIVHGDFRIGNLMFHPTKPEVVGVLDWELSTLGHPLADLGYCCMPWWTSSDEFGGIRDADHAALGLPAQAEFVETYYRHAVPTGQLLPFHVAFALFRFAVIFVGISDRSREGTATSADAAEIGVLAERFAARALEDIKG